LYLQVNRSSKALFIQHFFVFAWTDANVSLEKFRKITEISPREYKKMLDK
jgi:hypothetical protein